MKYLFIVGLFLTSTVFAQNMSRVNADFRCEQEGGGIAVKVGSSAASARVWQTDVGEDEGLELEVTDFKTARCIGCYSFKAILMGQIQVQGKITNGVLKYQAVDPDSGKLETLLSDIKCIPVR